MNLSTVLRPKDAEGRATRGVVFLFVLLSVVFANACYQEAFADEQPFVIKHPWKGTQYTDTTILVTEPGDTVEPGIHLTSPSTIYFDATPFSDLAWWEVILGDTGSTTPVDRGTTLSVVGGTGIVTAVTVDTVTIGNGAEFYKRLNADVGYIEASSFDDIALIEGGTGISTGGSGDTFTITNTAPNVDQNLWETFNGDTGTATAATTDDTFTFAGGTGISTAISGDTLTITNTDPNVDQRLWYTFDADTGTASASTTDDTFTFSGGTGISTAIVGDTMTITNTEPNVEQNVWVTIDSNSGIDIVASDPSDTLFLVGGAGMNTTNSGGNTVTFDNTTDIFSSIAADSGSVSASGLTDSITIVGADPIDTFATGAAINVEIDTAKDFDSSATWTFGDVGIGVTPPETLLHVQDGNVGTGLAHPFAKVLIEDNSNAMVQIVSGNTASNDRGYYGFGDADDPFTAGYIYDHGDDKSIFFSNNMNVGEFSADGDFVAYFDMQVDGELRGSRHSYQFGNPNSASSSQYMMANGVQLSSTRGEVMPRSGSIVGIAWSTNVTVKTTNSTLTSYARINGLSVFFDSVAVNSTGVKSGYLTQSRGTDTFAAGDLLSASIEFVTLLNTWKDTIITIEVVFDN